MIYYAQFTLLINDSTWGTFDREFEADSIEELFEEITLYCEENESKKESFLLDSIETEEGEEVEANYYDWLFSTHRG